MPSIRTTGLRLSALAAVLLAVPLAGDASARVPHHPFWLKRTTITEYWPAPESWFIGKKVFTPGLPGKHRIDWLYSAHGVAMEGDGVGLDGKRYHLDSLGAYGWVNAKGRRTKPGRHGWSHGSPFWRNGAFWLNASGRITFPLDGGGWYRGHGHKHRNRPHGIRFAAGPSMPLRYWKSIATDPRVIPRGSKVYIPAYKHRRNKGWFKAQDTGGAIIGRHVDVYRPPPKTVSGGRYLRGKRVYVVPPK